MNWKDFNTSVRTLLTVDAQRKGAGIQGYIDSVILSGVIELQQYIPTLRTLNRNTYRHTDMTRGTGLKSVRSRLDSRGKVTKATVMVPQADNSILSVELNRWPWDKRTSMDMDCLADCRSPRHPGKIMMQPGTRDFHIYPDLGTTELLVLDWEGVKTSFQDTDDTPYDHRVVKAISDYTKAHVVREVDKDLKLFQEYYAMYIKERASLYLDEKDSTLFDMPSITWDHYSRCCLERDADMPLAAPLYPYGLTAFFSPYPPTGIDYAFTTVGPTDLDIPNGYINEFGQFVVDAGVSVPAQPTSLETSPSTAPTGLEAAAGVPAPASGLDAFSKPVAPTGLRWYLQTAPLAPWGLEFFGEVASAPTGLDTPPYPAPSNLWAIDEALLPSAPQDLDRLAGPNNLEARRSTADGSIIDCLAPSALGAIHDGTGGTWVPAHPSQFHAQLVTTAPIAPTGIATAVSQYTFKHYVFDGTNFVLKSVDVFDVDPADNSFDVEVEY